MTGEDWHYIRRKSSKPRLTPHYYSAFSNLRYSATCFCSLCLSTFTCLEVRVHVSVTQFVEGRIKALRVQNDAAGLHYNVGVLRANTIKFLPNFFRKA